MKHCDGYPTLLFYKNGQLVMEYHDDLKIASLSGFLQAQLAEHREL